MWFRRCQPHYTIGNVVSDQEITVYVQECSRVRSVALWVEAGSLGIALLPGGDATALEKLTLFGTMDSATLPSSGAA